MFKMLETNNIYPDLSSTLLNDQQFRLNRISEIKDYFVAEIKERELMSKRVSKYINSFDYFDKSLIVLSITTGRGKLNSIESTISEALINNGIKHEGFMTIIDEEKKYKQLKESIRIINSQKSD